MKRWFMLVAGLALLFGLLPAFAGGAAAAPPPDASAAGQSPGFVQEIDNPYMPLEPGTVFVYTGVESGGTLRNVVRVTHDTKTILGVTCVVVNDKVYIDGELEEATLDWYAQDKRGNVWYFGEDSKQYANGVVVSTDGSWQAGVDGAQAGIVMEAHPHVGDTYRQEFLKGEAEDMAEVLSLNKTVTVPYGTFEDVLLTKEWTPLEPGVVEHKYYARGIGMVRSVMVQGGDEYQNLVTVKDNQADDSAPPD